MIKLPILIAISFIHSITFLSDRSPTINHPETGLFIWHFMVKPNNSEKFFNMVAPDSVYYHDDYAIESNLIQKQIERADGKTTITSETHGFYIIDFTKRQFFQCDSLPTLKNLTKENWQPIESKKIGVLFNYPFYNGENFVSKDTVIDNKPYQLIRYLNSKGSSKGAQVTLYIAPNMSSPIPFYAIQKKFTGRLCMISIIEKEGEVKMILEYQKDSTASPIYKTLEEMEKTMPKELNQS